MRLKNVFRNSFFSLLSQFVLILIGFFCQRVMNLTMGEALVGMNSVISNIIAILSVSELGIAVAVAYHLYQALADQDEKAIASLMNLYRRAYYIFAAVITIAGLCILPFVHLFMNRSPFPLTYIRLIYALWLTRTVLSYLLSYKRTILIADQKEYIVSIVTLLMNVVNYGSVIIILKRWQNYEWALLFNIVVEITLNFWIIRYVDSKYPFLKRNRRLPSDRKTMHMILHDLKSTFISRISSKLLISTDNLIISAYISVAVVGRYANYSLITQSVTNILLTLSNAIQPTIGIMFTEKNHETDYAVLRQTTFVFFLLAAFCSASLMSLMTRFVTGFWLSEQYRLDTVTVMCCVVNCCLCILALPTMMMMNVSGLFDRERNISVLYALTNLVFSLLLVKPLGLTGVLLGTSVSYIVQIFIRTRFFFRDYLGRNSRQYLLDLLQYGIAIFLETAITYHIINRFCPPGKTAAFLLAMLLCILIPNGINGLFFIRSWRMRSICSKIKTMICPDEKDQQR